MLKDRYIVVCAVRNEDPEVIGTHVKSLLNQTVEAQKIILVDDNSREPVTYPDDRVTVERVSHERHKRPGTNQAMALDSGVRLASRLTADSPWHYLLKTDADTILPPNYMEEMIKFMKENPDTGIASGTSTDTDIGSMSYRPSDGAKVFTFCCFVDICGFPYTPAFDTFMTLRARYQGFDTKTNPRARFEETRHHNKVTMNAWKWSGKMRKLWGFPWWHTAMVTVRNLKDGRPLIIGPLYMLYCHITYTVYSHAFSKEWIRGFARWEAGQVLEKIKRKIF